MTKRSLLAAAVFILCAAAPPMRPSRDVRVVYDMHLPNLAAPVQQILSWNLERHLLRIDLPATSMETLVDLQSNQIQLIRHDQRTITTMQGKAPAMPGAPAAATPDLARGATARLAGFDCTDWNTQNGATLCLTDDGVLLRAATHGTVLTQAVSVTYGPLPDALFALPAGYRQQRNAAPQ